MTPAIEYLIRTDLIKEWLVIPCSLFLYTNGDNYQKVIITICEELNKTNNYSVKHWHLNRCSNEQALPFMMEYSVPKDLIFNHPATILPNHNLLSYYQESIASHHNSFRQSMSYELYDYYFENTLESTLHTKKRLNWLWKQFVSIYASNLCTYQNYITSVYRSEASLADEQRNLICKYMKRQWNFWLMWQKYLLLNSGELVFYKEYLNVNN
jgi:hypothetical protein